MDGFKPVEALALGLFDSGPWRDLVQATSAGGVAVDFSVAVVGRVVVGPALQVVAPLEFSPWSLLAVLLGRRRVNLRQVILQACRRNGDFDSLELHARMRQLMRSELVSRHGAVTGELEWIKSVG